MEMERSSQAEISLRQSSQVSLLQTDNIETCANRAITKYGWGHSEYEVTLYNGNPASDNEIMMACGMICTAFNQNSKEFVALLARYIKSSGFTSERLSDAVDYVIGNHKYPSITIADVISYDRKIKFYNYAQAWSMVEEKGLYSWNDFESVKSEDGRILRYLKNGLT